MSCYCYAHAFRINNDEIANSIGWTLNSGFQMEWGFPSIGIGLVGFLRFWNTGYWLPFIIMKFVFGWEEGQTHILHMMKHNNFSPSNTGIVVYWDFLQKRFLRCALMKFISIYSMEALKGGPYRRALL
jgi:hypothetical protein